MQVHLTPTPFTPGLGFEVRALGGVPPYTFVAPVPPNVPGVTVTVQGNIALVDVPPSTPPGTPVVVLVGDSAPPATPVQVTNMTR